MYGKRSHSSHSNNDDELSISRSSGISRHLSHLNIADELSISRSSGISRHSSHSNIDDDLSISRGSGISRLQQQHQHEYQQRLNDSSPPETLSYHPQGARPSSPPLSLSGASYSQPSDYSNNDVNNTVCNGTLQHKSSKELSKDKNTKNNSPRPRKAWEWHYRSFLSRRISSSEKLQKKKASNRSVSGGNVAGNDRNMIYEDSNPSTAEYSVRSGKQFADIFKPKNWKSHNRSASITSQSSNGSDKSAFDVSTRNGKGKGNNIQKGLERQNQHQPHKRSSDTFLDTTVKKGHNKETTAMKKSQSLQDISASERSRLDHDRDQVLQTEFLLLTSQNNDNSAVTYRNHSDSARHRVVTVSPFFPSSLPSTLENTPVKIKDRRFFNMSTSDNNNQSSSPKSKYIRKSFTEFHSSNEYGKDSTSPYLGEDTSVHKHSLFLSMNSMSSSYSNVGMPSGRNGSRNNSCLLSSSPSRFDGTHHLQLGRSLPGHQSISLPPVTEGEIQQKWNRGSILDPIEGIETWDYDDTNHISAQLMAPAILAMVPFRVITMLSCSRSDYPFGKVVLGTALVVTKAVVSDDRSSSGWTRALFVVRQNYLLEYEDDEPSTDGKPRGFVHLQHSVVTPHAEFANALELEIYYAPGQGSEKQSRKKTLLMRVQSREDRDYWVHVLRAAANLSIQDLYDYDEVDPISLPMSRNGGSMQKTNILGNGRYSNIYYARRKQARSTTDEVGLNFEEDETSYDCALKIIPKQVFWDRVRKGKERADTLVRETTVQATLTADALRKQTAHPFVRLSGFFETRESMVLEMELLDGMDLFRHVLAKGNLNEDEAARIMRDILQCLLTMERLGIAHRDVKPANIFMCEDKPDQVRVRLGDYGMAAFASVDGYVRGRCGTPGYVAPEIFAAGVNSGYMNKVDVFSAGVTLYVLLCGYEPFYGENDAELVAANKSAYVEFADEDWADVSQEAIDLVKRMMEADPSERISAQNALDHPWISNHARPVPAQTITGDQITTGGSACTIS